MSDAPICPCDAFNHPKVIVNPPGRSVIAYRVGDYLTFRHALLRARPDEQALRDWSPTAKGDLAVQTVEWFAYLADILTFYNERIANQDYLRTADLPESVRRLIRILGYRPRPGIGAAGVVAALMNGPTALTLPAGFQIQSKPGPGKQPQTFEVDVATPVTWPDAVAADVPADPSLVQTDSNGVASVFLKGSITSLKPGDGLLCLERKWNGSNTNYALATVQATSLEKDPRGSINTRVSFAGPLGLPGSVAASSYRLLRSAQSAHVWQYPTGTTRVIDKNNKQVDLEAITRQIKVGDPVLFDGGSSVLPSPKLVSVTSYTEVVWYANPDPQANPAAANPTIAPAVPTPPIPIPHTRINFELPVALTRSWNNHRKLVLVRYAWQDVGELIATPATSFSGSPASIGSPPPTLTAVAPAAFPSGSGLPILLEDANGLGVSASGTIGPTPGSAVQLTNLPTPPVPLVSPLRVLFDLLSVSRGKTVANEVLGSGEASQPGQEFVLQNSPLTYLLSGDTSAGGNYKSTLRVWVDGVEWQEVSSFYGQVATARVFETREDENNQTHVQFGDGVNGARLSTGANNVVATYRYGSGADAPAAGSLTVVAKPFPNLKAIRNPVAVGGGADSDPPKQIRAYAPRSVLTFGRAISADDYETIAAQAPGVARARSYWIWDGAAQRALVVVYVGDDASARKAARTALAGAADPNRPVQVKLATLIPVTLTLTLRIDAAYVAADVAAAATAALVDDDSGLLGRNVVRIGAWVYDSQIYAACLTIAGTLAVHHLQFSTNTGKGFALEPSDRHDPGEGQFYQLLPTNLSVSPEVANGSS